MTQTQSLIIIVCGVVLWLIASIVRDWLISRREKPLYCAVASSLNFTFSTDSSMESLPHRDEFFLFTGKGSQHINYMLSGKLDHLDVRILDYSCSNYSGSHGRIRTRRQTVIMFQLHEYTWPDLTMMPDNFALKITKALGMKDIDISDAPLFSKRYFLHGREEAAIRGLFRQEVTNAFMQRNNWCVEAHRNVIVFWIKDTCITPNEIRSFLTETIDLLQLLSGILVTRERIGSVNSALRST
jgi:hypothetical protein